jgi:hypothetical protein
MSKVYSFRLDENNPREAQAREVIDAWASKGYSLRHLIIEALINFGNDKTSSKLEVMLEKVVNIISQLEREDLQPNSEKDNQTQLSAEFVNSIGKSVKRGIKTTS